MTAARSPAKVACINPNTGGRINIDAGTTDLFSKAIHHTLKKEGPLTFKQLVEGVQTYLQEGENTFGGSVSWYTVTVKNHLQATGVIEVVTQKGKKLHRLSNQERNISSER